MAEFVTIGGNIVRFVSFSEDATSYSGEETESFANTPLSSKRNPKKRWTGETIPYEPGEIALIRALAGNGGVNLLCTGPAFDGLTPTCRVIFEGAPYQRDRKAADGFKKSYTIRFRQV